MPTHITSTVQAFSCLGDACIDTCCKGWGMQLDEATYAKYQQNAPELLDVVTSGEAALIMKRDSCTDYCVKYEKGWCGIHREYGTELLGDACHFFPRITRTLGDITLMSAAASCPEVTRLALYTDTPEHYVDGEIPRLPYSLKDYTQDTLPDAHAFALHRLCMQHQAATPERTLMELVHLANTLPRMERATWLEAGRFTLQHATSRLPVPEPHPADMFNLAHAVAGIMWAAPQTARPRLDTTFQEIQSALDITLDPSTGSITLGADSQAAWENLNHCYDEYWAEELRPLLMRYLRLQCSMMLFPFSGLGVDMPVRAALLGMRFAFTKLALICHISQHDTLEPEGVIRVVQSISRLLDHLADPTLSGMILQETGWHREARLRALIGDTVEV